MKEPVEPRRMGVSEFAFAVSARPGAGDWSVLVVPVGRSAAAVAENLGEQLQIFSGGAVHLVDAPDDADEIVRQFETTAPGTLILKELQPLSEDTLQQLDFARSRFLREDAVVLVLHLTTLQRLLRVAPNLASFVEGFVATLDPDAERLSADEKEARLAALRTWAGRTDAQVIDLAERGQLPPDPAFAEWLVLLGHGRLIGRK